MLKVDVNLCLPGQWGHQQSILEGQGDLRRTLGDGKAPVPVPGALGTSQLYYLERFTPSSGFSFLTRTTGRLDEVASVILPAQTFLGVRFLNLKAALALSCTDVAIPGRGGWLWPLRDGHRVGSSAQELGIHPSSKEKSHQLVSTFGDPANRRLCGATETWHRVPTLQGLLKLRTQPCAPEGATADSMDR